jgi:hypothetical protein
MTGVRPVGAMLGLLSYAFDIKRRVFVTLQEEGVPWRGLESSRPREHGAERRETIARRTAML